MNIPGKTLLAAAMLAFCTGGNAQEDHPGKGHGPGKSKGRGKDKRNK